MNDPAPKPCPFCGNVGVTFITTQGDKWGNAECEHCGAIGPEVRTSYDVSPEAEWHQQAITEWNLRPNPETQAGAPNVQEVQHNDELMGKIFNITRSADSLDSSWLGKVRAAINEYIKGSAK